MAADQSHLDTVRPYSKNRETASCLMPQVVETKVL
jgi:hypothetical protein